MELKPDQNHDKHHVMNDRPLTLLHPLADELQFSAGINYLFDLSYLTGLDIIGEQGVDFLQGQLTCDLRDVDQTHMRPGALCNLQGRIMALMDVVQWQGLHLILPSDLMQATKTLLAKIALFSRVQLQENRSFAVMGLYLQNQQDPLIAELQLPHAPYDVHSTVRDCCYQITEQLFIFLLQVEQVDAFKKQFHPTQQRGSLAWHLLQLQTGRIEIYPNSSGLFLPHRLGLQNTPYLSFHKGCYKGQEIIARTHYRAKIKHSMKLFKLETVAPLYAGQKLFDPTTQSEIGELIDYCPINDRLYQISISSVFDHSLRVQFENQPDESVILLQ